MGAPFSNRLPSLLQTTLTVDSTRAPPLAALGRFTTMLARTMAIEVSMKMMSRTSTMSTKGMMLMLARSPSSSPLPFCAAAMAYSFLPADLSSAMSTRVRHSVLVTESFTMPLKTL